MVGQPVEYRELHSIATQTDDYGCNNGCTSMYVNTVVGEYHLANEHDAENTLEDVKEQELSQDMEEISTTYNITDPHHVSNISETLPPPQPSVSVDGEYDFDNKYDPENTLKDKNQQELNQDGNHMFQLSRVLEELEFSPGNNLVEIKNESKDDSAGDAIAEKRQLYEREGCSSQHSETSLKCSYCAKQLKNKSTLIVHLRTHTGEKTFECSHCKKKFAQKGSLKIHLGIHTGEKPFKCSYCEKSFQLKSYFDSHLRIHTGEKPFECSYCEKKFIQQGYLKYHLRTHTGEKPFECSYCKKKFAQKSNLNTHLRIHTKERPFECSHCKKTFAGKDVLNAHLRIHTGEKPFECDYCKKKFVQKSNLTSHLRRHTGEKPFECFHCKKKFRHQSTFTKHLTLH